MPFTQRVAPVGDPHQHPPTGVETIGPTARPYAMVFRRTQVAGAQFMTPPSLELQVGVLERPAGFSVRAHTHPARARTASSVAEFLYLESGRVRVRVFDEAWQELALIELLAGEMVLLLRGGHALDVLEHARLVEVRQGPYQALGDKRFA